MFRSTGYVIGCLLVFLFPAIVLAQGTQQADDKTHAISLCRVMDAYGNFSTYGGIVKGDEITLDVKHPEQWKLEFPKSHFTFPLKHPFSPARSTGAYTFRAIASDANATLPRVATADIWLSSTQGDATVWIVSQTSEMMDGIVVMNCARK